MKTRGWIAVLLSLTIMLAAGVASAQTKWRPDDAGPTFADMMSQSANVVFAQITSVSVGSINVSVAKALKGNAHDEIRITGFKSRAYAPVDNLKETFKVGEDYFFFLGAAMVGSVPFEPIHKSVDLKVERGVVTTSVISPIFAKYQHEIDFQTMSSYLEGLAAVERRMPVNPVLLGQLYEKLEQAVADPQSTMAPTYLTMVRQLNPLYDNAKVFLSMLEHADVNCRVLAIQELTHLALTKPNMTLEPKEPENPKKGKKKQSKRSKKRRKAKKQVEPTMSEIAFQRILSTLKSDQSNLVKSTAAIALGRLQNPAGINELGDLIDASNMDEVELCEVVPVVGVEPTMKAIIRAVVEFDDDRALDVLERELLKNRVDSFRVILEVFKDYSDTSLQLLLLDLLQDRNFLPRQVAILEYFHTVKDKETIDGLKKLFLSPDAGSEFIRKSIIEVFEDFREPKSTGAFVIQYGLHDPNPVVRQAAARSLGKLNVTEAVEEFKAIYFKESNRLAREFYVEAMAEIKSRLAFETLKWLQTKETDPRMLKQIAFALKKSRYLSQ